MSDEHAEKLQPPRISIEDPGAHELDSSDSEDHFSDAQTGQSGVSSPIPITRVEKVDEEPSHGEVPGTDAFNMRSEDAEPDEVIVIPEDNDGTLNHDIPSHPSTLGGQPIPISIVEKDHSSPNYGEVPGTIAHESRKADEVPDVTLKTSVGTSSPVSEPQSPKVNSASSPGEILGKGAYELPKGDAESDIVEDEEDAAVLENFEPLAESGSPSSSSARSSTINHARRKSSLVRKASIPIPPEELDYDEAEDGAEDMDFGDDFDDFEEGEDADFGGFDDGFQGAEPIIHPPVQSVPTMPPSFPVLNFNDLDTREEILNATEPYMDALFPPDTISTSLLPSPTPSHPIFLTQRSASLWSQLVAPPPLQPPNWIRSRIRRLFLVSLGVPIDLDEILPASKQKKLILPSTLSSGSPRNSSSISRLKQTDGNNSSTSVDSQGKPSSSSRRKKGPPPAPELDLLYARQLCSVTDEALNGLTPPELKEHVEKLENMQGVAEEVLAYWTKRTDEKIGDREAFEGVIENLVMHARKVRK